MLRGITFGQCAFDAPGARIAPDSELHFALLLLVATAPADGVSRDEVLARLWPHAIGNDGRHCLRQGMYRLRQLGIPVQLNAGRIILDWSHANADVHDLLHREPARTELVRLGTLPFLPGYLPSLGDPYADWVEELRASVAARLRRALADEASAARSRGRFHEMGRLARALLALDPLNELGTIILAESLALEGSKVEALRLLEAYEAEVGVVNANLQLPARVLRRRVAEVLDDSLFLRRYEVPFVGREETFSTLRGVWREVRRGKSQAAIVSGEAGIGKSRLVGELLRLAALDGGSVLRYSTSAGDAFTPLSTLISVASQLLTLPGALGCEQEHLHYLRRLGTTETVSAFSVSGMAADILYAQLVLAFSEVMSAIAEEAPLIVFIDDAERLHPTTWRVLVDVWDRVGQRGVLILMAARRLPEWFGSLGVRSCERLTVHIPVPPLAAEEARDFVGGWCERHDLALDDAAVDALIGAAHGNPFYLTELANHVGRGGDPQRTPENIAALIATQCRGLGVSAQQVLLAIAVLESRGTTSRATQVLGLPAAEIMRALEDLEATGLVTSGGALVRVRHEMIGEVVQTLAGARVVQFTHGRVAEVLEREADETDSVELLGDCVTHWERAGEVRRAYSAAMKLGHRLMGAGMGEEAEKAFARAQRLAIKSDEIVLAIEGRMRSCSLTARWRDFQPLAVERASHISRVRIPRDRLDNFELLEAEATFLALNGSPDSDRLFAIAANTRHSRAHRLRAAVLSAVRADNHYDEPAMRKSLSVSSDLLDDTEGDDAATLQLVFHATLGDRDEVRRYVALIAEQSRECDDYSSILSGQRRCAEGCMRIGDPSAAQHYAEQSLALSTRLQLPIQVANAQVLLIRILLELNLVESARKYADAIRQQLAVDERSLETHSLSADALLAWHTQDADLMQDVGRRIRTVAPPPVPRAEHVFQSILQAVTLLARSVELPQVSLSRLHELHLKGMTFGGQDFASAVLFEALRRDGRTAESRRLRRHYLVSARRERSTVASGLLGLAP